LSLVAVGGALGSTTRYALTLIFPQVLGQNLAATLIANLVGAGLAGILLGLFSFWGSTENTSNYQDALRLILLTGFCGGLTTFSTLTYETHHLVDQSRLDLAFLYMLLTMTVGFFALRLGLFLSSGLVRP
jgi:CrcB protein